jgi:nucleoside-diphosphate kinase
MAVERTLILLKPDCVQRGKCGEVVSRLESRGMQIVGMKMMHLDKSKCDEHYAHLVSKPFYPKLAAFMTSAPVIGMVVEGVEAVKVVRDMCGPTNARNAPAGTIRGDFALSTQYNIIHASDSLETANKEIVRFFSPNELFAWKRALDSLTAADDEKK